MSINVSEKSGPSVPAGTHIATCFRVVDLGMQPDSGYGPKEKIVIFWELPHQRITVDGHDRPMAISRFYTRSLNKKASLRKDLDNWRGRPFTTEELAGFDLAKILGKSCQLQVIEDEGKSKVAAVVGLPKGMTVPPPQNPMMEWSVSAGRDENFKLLPEWVQKAASECAEWNGEKAAAPVAAADDGEAPAF